jgi:putative NADH-flavin reductase
MAAVPRVGDWLCAEATRRGVEVAAMASDTSKIRSDIRRGDVALTLEN